LCQIPSPFLKQGAAFTANKHSVVAYTGYWQLKCQWNALFGRGSSTYNTSKVLTIIFDVFFHTETQQFNQHNQRNHLYQVSMPHYHVIMLLQCYWIGNWERILWEKAKRIQENTPFLTGI